MRRLGVLGWPVAHSRSPDMHNAALRALGMEEWRYQLLPVPVERFADTVRALPGAGFVGANVTIPHKHAALALADEASASALEIGAANTLTFLPGGGIAAENTDAPGFLAALGVPVRGMSAQVLGAGGSARAVAWALREAGAREVSVCNRTPERASALARELGVRAVARPAPADLLVNCTSVGLGNAHPDGGLGGADPDGDLGGADPDKEPGDGRDSAPPAALRQSASEPKGLNLMEMALDGVGDYAYVVDFAYSASPTPLLSAANAHGAHTVDGLEVLLAQGALSFELWTGREAPLQVMREAIRAAPAR